MSPWKASDAKDHISGLTDTQASRWAAVANDVLQKCLDDGGKDEECSGKAIRQANAVAKRANGNSGTSDSEESTEESISASAITEAATLKKRAQRLVKDIEGILSHKELDESLISPLRNLRQSLRLRWNDICAHVPAFDEANKMLAASRGPQWKVNEAANFDLKLVRTSLDCYKRTLDIFEEANDILAADDSMDAMKQRISQAIVAEIQMQGGNTFGTIIGEMSWPYVRDIYPDAAIFEYNQGLYRADYAVSEDGSISISNIAPVQVAYVPKSANAKTQATNEEEGNATTNANAEADTEEYTSDTIPLNEARIIRDDGSVRIKIIQPGWGSSGYYPEDVLKRDGPNIFTSGTQMFWDHPTQEEEASRPEGSLRNLAGTLVSNAVWSDEDGPGLYADAKVFTPYDEILEEVAPHIGNSIRALGKGTNGIAEGKEGRIITELVRANSVDYVTRAGAGGRVVEMVEAARVRRETNAHAEKRMAAPAAVLKESHIPTEGDRNMGMTPEEVQALQEANTRALEDARKANERANRIEEALLLRDGREYATSVLATIRNLPDLTRDRIVNDVVLHMPVTESDGVRTLDRDAFAKLVRETAAAELKYLAETTGVGKGTVRGMNSRSTMGDLNEGDDTDEGTYEKAREGLVEIGKRFGLKDSEAKIFAGGRDSR